MQTPHSFVAASISVEKSEFFGINIFSRRLFFDYNDAIFHINVDVVGGKSSGKITAPENNTSDFL